MSQAATISALHAIREKSKQLKLLVSRPNITRSLPPPPTSFPVLLLPFPTDILHQIEELPLPHDLIQRFKTKLTGVVTSLHKIFTQQYQQTCERLTAIPDGHLSWDAVRKVFESFYRNHQLANLQLHFGRIRTMIETRRPPPRKVTFNAVSSNF